MSICTVATGTVVGAPARVETDHGTAVVFVLAPSQSSELGRELGSPWPAPCEVWCRQPRLAAAVMDSVQGDESVVLVGRLWLEPAIGLHEDELCAARVRIEADRIGLALASWPDP
jgi:hypothetical protein